MCFRGCGRSGATAHGQGSRENVCLTLAHLGGELAFTVREGTALIDR